MTMRDDFDNILRNYGHDVYLQRVTNTVDNAGSPVFEGVLERHTVRHMYPGNRGLSGVAQEHLEGVLFTSERIYYFRWDVNPKEGDRLYDETPGIEGNQTTWLIDSALPMRGLGGVIVYWVIGCTRKTPS